MRTFACRSTFLYAQSTYIRRVQSCVWRLPKYWPPTPPSPSECVLPPRKGDRGTIFWKTPAIGLASYNNLSTGGHILHFAYFAIPHTRQILRCASSNTQVFLWLIRNFYKILQNSVWKTVIKVVVMKRLFHFVQISIRAWYAIFVRKKTLFLRTCGCFKSVKKLVVANPQVTNKIGSAKSHMCRRSANLTLCKFTNLRICDWLYLQSINY